MAVKTWEFSPLLSPLEKRGYEKRGRKGAAKISTTDGI
jgi:hypothetical protein